MPNDRDSHAPMNPAPDGGELPSAWPPFTDAATHAAPQATRALVDGLGVYTASAGSPFLTAPLPSNGASGSPQSRSTDPPDTLSDQLRELREPLERKVQGVPLRLRLSEEEVSGLVTAVLDLMARHLRLASSPTRREY